MSINLIFALKMGMSTLKTDPKFFQNFIHLRPCHLQQRVIFI